MVIAIIILAVLLTLLMFRPRRAADTRSRPFEPRYDDRNGSDVGESPAIRWRGGETTAASLIDPDGDDFGGGGGDDFTGGGGDFGGGGASGDWSDSSDSGGDTSSD